MDDAKLCLLVVIGATEDGRKELVAVEEGYRESEQSWLELLRRLEAKGLTLEPKLAVGDGALGFWKALRKVFGNTRQQRCWVHKTANVLNHMPKSVQPKAKQALHDIWMAETREEADKAFDLFCRDLPGQVPEGRRVLGEGSHRAARLLRLPGRALGPPAHDQPHRVDLRHRPAAHRQDPQLPEPTHHARHGLQALPGRTGQLETTARL